MVRDVSIDIETLASGTNAAITQIGIAYRYREQGPESDILLEDGDIIRRQIDVLDDTGEYSARTLQWHRSHKGVALPGPNGLPLEEALAKFKGIIEYVGGHREGKALLWTHATFDIPRIADAYQRLGQRPPWHYRNCRDLRTLYDLAGGRPNLPRVGDHHLASDDAVYQLMEIEECRENLDAAMKMGF